MGKIQNSAHTPTSYQSLKSIPVADDNKQVRVGVRRRKLSLKWENQTLERMQIKLGRIHSCYKHVYNDQVSA